MPDNAQVDRRESIEALRRELDARTAEHDEVLAARAFPHREGGLEATPEDLADPVAENRRLREQLCEVRAERALPIDGGGVGWGCRSRGPGW
jgi:hypothetical protein